ncbi:MAG: hypothetical protein QOE54_4454 [Streptosporangiaceae bacterium]|jgi:hypothetical protein|nr:Transcription elongation regulator 1 [Streptosporangiaceae bacterium]MDX6432088.1 hypothetical protein [Streptosporangiaceae bacterium]
MSQPPPPGGPWAHPQTAPVYPGQNAGPYPHGGPQYGAPPQAYPGPPAQPYAGQPYGTPAQPYPPQQYQGQQYAPQPYPGAHLGAGGPQCRFCGCVPATDVTFRGHRGMIVLMQFLHVKGPFCRDCGLSTFRDMTAKTLIQGWYGYISFAVTPITVLINLARRGKVANLPAPQPPPSGDHRRPMDPGAPLLARPSALIGLAIPFVLLVLFIILAAAGG